VEESSIQFPQVHYLLKNPYNRKQIRKNPKKNPSNVHFEHTTSQPLSNLFGDPLGSLCAITLFIVLTILEW